MATTAATTPSASKAVEELIQSRPIRKVAVLGANGTMGFQSAALFTLAGIEVAFLARTKEKAEEGLKAAERGVRSSTVSELATTGSYDDAMEKAVSEADLIFEALAENFEIKKAMFDKVEKWRRPDSIVATVTSGLSITQLAEGRDDSFQKNFIGLHFFSPAHVMRLPETVRGVEAAHVIGHSAAADHERGRKRQVGLEPGGDPLGQPGHLQETAPDLDHATLRQREEPPGGPAPRRKRPRRGRGRSSRPGTRSRRPAERFEPPGPPAARRNR